MAWHAFRLEIHSWTKTSYGDAREPMLKIDRFRPGLPVRGITRKSTTVVEPD
jgi:hypothetical protein